jgi:predicted dienelactone hydrolase
MSAPTTKYAKAGEQHFGVVVRSWNWFDPARHRLLATRVYLPISRAARDSPFPLFVWAHGYEATVDYFDPYLRAIAAHGYVVAAPTFPLTNAAAVGGARYGDYVNQPADVTFVISKLLAAYGASGSAQRDLIDFTKIGVGGHSLGAATTAGLVSNRCCFDRRIKAAVEVDGARLSFPRGSTVERGTPLLLIHGDADHTFAVSESRAVFAVSRPPKYLVILHRMPHTPFRIPSAYAIILNTTVDFLDLYLKGETRAKSQLQFDGAVPGTTSLTFAP